MVGTLKPYLVQKNLFELFALIDRGDAKEPLEQESLGITHYFFLLSASYSDGGEIHTDEIYRPAAFLVFATRLYRPLGL